MSSPVSVLFVNRVFPPAEGATGEILKELCDRLVGQGLAVTVLSVRTDPEQPLDETAGSLRLRRCASAVQFTRGSQVIRAISYASAYLAMSVNLVSLRRHDIIVFMTDPPMLACMGLLARLATRARLVHWAQDIYPEIAEELGVLKRGGLAARVLRTLSTLALRRFDLVIPIGRCMRERLISRGLDEKLLTVLPNWADTKNIRPIESEASSFRNELGLTGKRVVMYSGNMGLGHSFDTMVSAIGKFATSHPDVVFLFTVTGGQVAQVQSRIHELGLRNAMFHPLQPRDRLADTLGAGDVHLATMADSMAGLMVPSKVYGILAAGRPCILIGPCCSEAARVIETNRCGTVVDENDADGLIEALSYWLDSTVTRIEAGKRARQVAEMNDLNEAAGNFELLFHRLTASS